VLSPPTVSPDDLGTGHANAVLNRLKQYVRLTPLDSIADAVMTYEVSSEVAKNLFGCYDQFLGVLSNLSMRKELDDLRPNDAAGSATFQHVRTISYRFQDALNQLFFGHERIGNLTREYGVF